MGMYDDVMMVENGEGSEMEQAQALQRMINAGTVWGLQGSFGREAMRQLEAGNVMLGKNGGRDAYGNRIPGRDDVDPGTKGSYDLVAEVHGVEYADALAVL